jgi:pimeloyl-ACP methyl ester carboxylesterase
MAESPSLLLLHGALGSAEQVRPLAESIGRLRAVDVYTFPGHGGQPIPAGGLSMEALSEALADHMATLPSGPPDVFGYSMGGYAAALVALRYPGRIRSLVTLGTKWRWDPAIAAGERRMLDPDILAEKVPALADLLSRRHHPMDWRDVVHATADMLVDLGKNPLLGHEALTRLDIPVTILRGGEDRMVSQEESEQAATALIRGHYAELPGQKHPFEQTDLSLLLPWLT